VVWGEGGVLLGGARGGGEGGGGGGGGGGVYQTTNDIARTTPWDAVISQIDAFQYRMFAARVIDERAEPDVVDLIPSHIQRVQTAERHCM